MTLLIQGLLPSTQDIKVPEGRNHCCPAHCCTGRWHTAFCGASPCPVLLEEPEAQRGHMPCPRPHCLGGAGGPFQNCSTDVALASLRSPLLRSSLLVLPYPPVGAVLIFVWWTVGDTDVCWAEEYITGFNMLLWLLPQGASGL